MSEAPKRVRLNVCIGSFEHLLRCESGTETMYVSEDALRELCEQWRARKLRAGWESSPQEYVNECADDLEALLEGDE